MRGKINSIKKLVRSRFHSNRFIYFGAAILIFFSLASYAILYHSPKASAYSVDTSSSSDPTGSPAHRYVVTTSDGKLVAFYYNGSVTKYAVSTDNGSTWAVQSGTISFTGANIDVAIDSSNNIYVSGGDSSPSVTKLTYASGSWTVGASSGLPIGSGCGQNGGSQTYSPTISVNSSGVVEVVIPVDTTDSFCSTTSSDQEVYYSDSTLASWTGGSAIPSGSGVYEPIVSDGSAFWMVLDGTVYKDASANGTFTSTGISANCLGEPSLAYSSSKLHIMCMVNGVGIEYYSFNTTNNTISGATLIESGTNNFVGSIVTYSQQLWAINSRYVATNSFNVVYKHFNGSSWDASATSFTTNNLNNLFENAPERVTSFLHIPFIWTTGTANPYTINAAAFSGNATPVAPTPISPISYVANVPTHPTFQLRTTDADNDYLKYKIVIYNSDCSTNPQTFDQTSSQTGWTGQDQQTGTAYTGSSTLTSSTIANFSGVTLSAGTTYCWQSAAIDPGGTNAWSSYSGTQTFTTAAGSSPSAPALLVPMSGATGTSTSPLFQLRTTDADNDYLKYKIVIYNSDCSTNPQTFDQTSSQTGWTGQDQQTGTAYTGSSTLTSSTIASFGLANLSANTQYCWKGAAIDPGGSNTFGGYSPTQLFTTGAANSGGINITGGATVRGGGYVR